jgi:hypothetical protein
LTLIEFGDIALRVVLHMKLAALPRHACKDLETSFLAHIYYHFYSKLWPPNMRETPKNLTKYPIQFLLLSTALNRLFPSSQSR